MLNMKRSLYFDSIDFSVPIPQKWKDKFGKANHDQEPRTRPLLQEVTGRFKSGRLTCILGSSGAGKSTLLNCLSGEIQSDSVRGGIFLKDEVTGELQCERSAQKRRQQIGYVYQEDILLETMTVHEAVWMAARLKLPHLSDAEIRIRVDDILVRMRLDHIQESRIGSTLARGISGGERKRVAIAMTLVTNPGILFLDEPTSGLDAFTAKSVCQVLKQLAVEGDRTVVATIHQPSSEVFHLFDDVCVLDKGKVVYFGPVHHVVKYFAGIGFECPVYTNPADFIFMSILHDDNSPHQTKSTLVSQRVSSVEDGLVDGSTETLLNSDEQTESMKHAFLVESWLKSDLYYSLKQDVDEVCSRAGFAKNGSVVSNVHSFRREFGYLIGRAFRNVIRNPMLFNVKIAQVVFVSLIMGSIYHGLDTQPYNEQLANRFGALFFLTINMIMMYTFGVLNVFAEEKQVFLREYQNGYYTLPAYFLSKTLVEIPFQIVFPAVQGLITYILVFTFQWERFIFFEITLILLANCGQSMGVAAASAFEDVKIALAVVPMLLLPFMIFSGVFIKMSSIPVYFVWLKWLSPMKYGYTALMKNEYRDWYYDTPAGRVTGDEVLEQLGLNEEGLTMSIDMAILFAMYIGLMVLAYCFLWRSATRRRV